MRHAYENQDIVKAKGEKAREDMKQMTWNKSGEILKEMMEKAVL
jgi:hypothetical protein